MKNKELLNICYRLFNRFIIADQLIEKLNNIDKSNFDKDSIYEVGIGLELDI